MRGNKARVASQGYTCEKAQRLNHYQNGMKRITSPMRRERILRAEVAHTLVV